MKTETKKIEQCRLEVRVEIDAEEAAKTRKETEKAFMREARVPGFRPGKVPLSVIKKEFAEKLQEQTLLDMIKKFAVDATKAEKLDVVDMVEAKDAKLDDKGGSFAVVVDVKPTFKLPAYKGLKIEKRDVTVKDEDLAKAIESMKKYHAKYEDAKGGETVSDGDFVQIDYSGTIDGKPISEINPEAKIVASGEGFWTMVEEGRFLPELLDAVKGMKAGETKEGIKAKFAADGSAPEGLGGAEAEYKLTLKMFRRMILPDDAELAKLMKEESFEALATQLRKRMQENADSQEARRREDEAMELLLKKCDFAIPQMQAERAKNNILSRYAERAQVSGIDASYFEKNREKIQSDAEAAADRQVRAYYILSAIADAENIDANDEGRNVKALDAVVANAK